MSEVMEETVENVNMTLTHCRFCAEKKNYAEVLDLAGDLKTLNEYLKIIECLKIDYLDLSPANKLPKSTCETCYDKFQDAYNFFQKVTEIQLCLKNSSVLNVKREPTEIVNRAEKNKDEGTILRNILSAGPCAGESNQANTECDQTETDKNSEPETSTQKSVNSSSLKLCLFCAEPKISDDLLNLTEETIFEEYTKIVDFFKIDHFQNKMKIPKSSCERCYITFQNAYNFFKNVKHNQSLLKNMYSIKREPSALMVKLEEDRNISENKESQNKDTNPLSVCAISIQEDNSWTNYSYICCHCRVTFDNMEELRSHSKEKHNVCYALRCADCDEQFSGYNEFVEHVRQHRDILRLYCQYCNMKFDTTAQCTEHVDTHYIGTQKICEMCGEMLPYANTLEWHRKLYGSASLERRTKHKRSWEDYDWICQDCGIKTPDVASLRIHTQSAHDKCFAMKCADCSKVMRSFKMFVSHVVDHRPYLKNFCQYCNSSCDDADHMNNHIIQHITSQQRPCNGCGQIFKDNLHLAKHKQTFSNKPKDPLKQEKARNAAKRRRTTKKIDTNKSAPKRRRAKTSLSTNDLTCTICCKLFETITKLKRHIKTHDGKRRRNFVCKICGRAFLTSHTMKEHAKTHSNKSEVCQVCKKEFHTTRALKHHIVTHSEERPFVCDECGNSFKSKRRLKCHLISHSEVKPFKCMYCYKEFNFKMNLKTHEYQHTGLRPYSCEMCERTFTNWTNCNKHMIRKHGVTLAKTKITSQGRVTIDRRTGEVKNLLSDEKTREWLDEMMKPGKPGKKTDDC